MELNKEFKNTEVGSIPTDWDVKSLGERLSGSPKYGINAAAIEFDSRFPTYLRITDITDEGKINKNSLASVNHPLADDYKLENYDVVFARTGASVGKSYLYQKKDGDFVYAGFLIRVRPERSKLHAPYLFYFSKSGPYWKWIRENSMRSGQPGVNGKQYSELPLPLPPTIKEQEAIASALSDADGYIESLEKLITKKRLIKKGITVELLSGKRRLVKSKDSSFIKTEIGTLPKDWCLQPLHYVAVKDGLVRGPFGGALKKEFFVSAGFKVYEQRNAIYKTVEIGNYFVNEEKYKELYRFRINSGDLIVSCSGTIGCIYQIPENAPTGIINQALLKIALDLKKIDIGYFLELFRADEFQNRIKDSTQGGAMQNLVGMEIFRNSLIPVPSLEEQRAIAEVLKDMDSDILLQENQLQKARLLKQGIMQELLTGRIRLL